MASGYIQLPASVSSSPLKLSNEIIVRYSQYERNKLGLRSKTFIHEKTMFDVSQMADGSRGKEQFSFWSKLKCVAGTEDQNPQTG